MSCDMNCLECVKVRCTNNKPATEEERNFSRELDKDVTRLKGVDMTKYVYNRPDKEQYIKARNQVYEQRRPYDENRKETKRQYYLRHKEDRLSYQNTYNQEHREEVNARQRAVYEAHKEEINARRRERYAKKKELIKGACCSEE